MVEWRCTNRGTTSNRLVDSVRRVRSPRDRPARASAQCAVRDGGAAAPDASDPGPVDIAVEHRTEVARLVDTAASLPAGVQRQFTIQQIISEEMESGITGQKPIDTVLADAERRVNDLLFNLL